MTKEKKKKPEIIKNNLNVLKIRRYDESTDGFINDDASYFDLFRFVSRDRLNRKEDEVKYSIYRMSKFYRTYAPDLKIVSLNFHISVSGQKKSLNKIYEKSFDQVRRKWLKREIEELEILEANITRREYYLFIYADTKDEFIKNKSDVIKSIGTGKSRLVEEVDRRKKIQIVRKLCNMNTLILPEVLIGEEESEKSFMEEER